MKKMRIGLIVNPMAGIGGAVGLKGSDGESIQRQSIALGAVPVAPGRTVEALEQISKLGDRFTLFTSPGEMGEDVAKACGFEPEVRGEIKQGFTSGHDTQWAAEECLELGIQLLLFAGGDGTARDICAALSRQMPVIGIPSGVKMHSAVFTHNPKAAGSLARLYLDGRVTRFKDAEVMDLDEEAYRLGQVTPMLYGFLKVPVATGFIQSMKVASRPSDEEDQSAIAEWLAERMDDENLYILGPGTTIRAITDRLALDKTLIGVDAVKNGQLVTVDANEGQLLNLLEGNRAKIVVTPIGGQGHIFGRGNQQISHRVIRVVGREHIIVVCTPEKLHSLLGMPLRVDTGNGQVDLMLSGHIRVVTGYDEQAVYRVQA